MTQVGAAYPLNELPRPRYELVDVLRGVAIIGVVAYHFFWDLSYLWLIETDVSTHPAWVFFARSLLFTFIALVGVGLVLAHGQAIRWRSFWRRLAIVGGAALLVTIGTLVAFSETFVYFGVLHAIALFSLLGLAFLRLNVFLTFAVGTAIVAAPFLFTHPAFEAKALSWIGFFAVPPPSNDLVPIFPWLGVTLWGIAATRIAIAKGWLQSIGGWHAHGLWSGFAFAGRWSLPIYLVHQLILLAILTPTANVLLADQTSVTAFRRTCEIGCINTGAEAGYCTSYCACALNEVETRDLWSSVQALDPTPEQSQAVGDVVLQCSGVLPEQIAPRD